MSLTSNINAFEIFLNPFITITSILIFSGETQNKLLSNLDSAENNVISGNGLCCVVRWKESVAVTLKQTESVLQANLVSWSSSFSIWDHPMSSDVGVSACKAAKSHKKAFIDRSATWDISETGCVFLTIGCVKRFRHKSQTT